MDTIAWWPNVIVLLIASATDLRWRRIPNWLSAPFIVSGLSVPAMTGGWAGLRSSLFGFCAAVLLFALPCYLRAMGMGDLKLAAGAGAWIGPGQFMMAFIVTGMVGGLMAIVYAVRRPSLGRCLDSSGGLDTRLRLDSPGALAIPYAPAIAAGVLFSFFAR